MQFFEILQSTQGAEEGSRTPRTPLPWRRACIWAAFYWYSEDPGRLSEVLLVRKRSSVRNYVRVVGPKD